ncbi:hypothetical protein DE146DRAFT_264227 [Phaeosphaeria sp. MPI-PUGE-AT-0046c]|nr:hypothetical protein DE146DRAFT_264227 [Phaeosphaeria sp. MPI-PUGE-AT-0046c]
MAHYMPTPQPTDGAPLSKPTHWSNYMVAAAVIFTSEKKLPASYKTVDNACMDISDVLNWYKAHKRYNWPDFIGMGYDFNLSMHLSRQLVSDVFVALRMAGSVEIESAEDSLASPVNSVDKVDQSRSGAGKYRVAEKVFS